MTTTLFTNISELWTMDPLRESEGAKGAGVIRDAALVAENGRVVWVGKAADAPDADAREDLGGRAVLPGWVDSHSHMVFDGDRSAEFEARMAGESYAAGGIQVTTDATRSASDERLSRLLGDRVRAAALGGTTTMETKTGYGLTVEDEVRSAAIARDHVDAVTFLGAHLVPSEFNGEKGSRGTAEDYVDLVVGEMLTQVAPHVDFIDVFCEKGAFDVEQSRRVLDAGKAAGLGVRVHGNQLGESGGVQLAVETGAASVDHVNFLSQADVEALAGTVSRDSDGQVVVDAGESGVRPTGSGPTVATILPACDISTRMPFAPARELLDAGAAVAIASNLNPGTSFTSAMNFCVGTAVLQQHMSLAEALFAATRGGAIALRMADVGHLTVGARADLHVLDAPAAIHLAYRPGMPMTWKVFARGAEVK